MKVMHMLLVGLAATAMFNPTPTTADFGDGVLIGYAGSEIQDQIESRLSNRIINDFCSAQGTLGVFPPPTNQCSAQEYKVYEPLPEPTLFSKLFSLFIVSLVIFSVIHTCLFGTDEERETLIGIFVGSFIHAMLSDDDD